MGDNPVLPKRAFRPTIERVYRGMKCPTELPSEFQFARRRRPAFLWPSPPPPPAHPSLYEQITIFRRKTLHFKTYPHEYMYAYNRQTAFLFFTHSLTHTLNTHVYS